jgi:phosphoribosylformimino-5-aminoimidazole carboxamide ribotide isomerase
MIIFPAIDLKDGKCVRLSQGKFESVTTYSEDPLKIARRFKEEGAQWLHVVDLDGARMGSPQAVNLQVVRQIVRQVGLPVQFGGGVRNGEVVERMLNVGVTRVVVGTAVAQNDQLAQGLFTVYGDKVAVGVDAKEGLVAIHGWQQTTGEPAGPFVAKMALLGAKRFIFTDVARDGMLQGVNEPALADIARCAGALPVIASGGVSGPNDISTLVVLARQCPNIEGVIVGKALYAGAITLKSALELALGG